MTVQVRPARSLLQQARLAQWLTVGWMVIEGAIAIGAGVVAHSVALTAFGVDSGIELFSSVVVLRFGETRLARWSACTWRVLHWPDCCSTSSSVFGGPTR